MPPRQPKLTIGIPVHTDFYGIWQTLTDLRTDFMDVMPDTEIVVIDNAPSNEMGSHSEATRRLLAHMAEGVGVAWDGRVIHKAGADRRQKGTPLFVRNHPADVKYETLRDQGPAGSKDRVFSVASGEVVLVMDCHVKLWPGSLQRLLAFYDAGLDNGNLLQGPLVYDDFNIYQTHMDDVIRGNMRGVWAVDERGFDLDADPFEIPGHGMGMFSCRRDKWLGFNKAFRGFGGEEYYIHTKYKRAGRQTMCLPFLRWIHRFDRPDGTRYQNDIRHRIRNYLIGALENEDDIDRLKRYFRDGIPEDPRNEDAKRVRINWTDWETLCLDLGIDP